MQKLGIVLLCLFTVPHLVLSSQEACTCDVMVHERAILNWTFPFLLTKDKHLIQVTQKSEESLNNLHVIRLDRGELRVYSGYTGRVWLSSDGLADGVVTLKIDHVHITDAGEYTCFVEMPPDVHWRMCHLKVRAPWSPVQKSSVSMRAEEYALSCESEGFPVAAFTWTDGWGKDFTERAKVTTHTSPGQLLHMASQLNITLSTSSSSNYTCTLTDDRGHSQADTFVLPGLRGSRQRYMLIPPVLGLLVGLLVLVLLKRPQPPSVMGQE